MVIKLLYSNKKLNFKNLDYFIATRYFKKMILFEMKNFSICIYLNFLKVEIHPKHLLNIWTYLLNQLPL